MEIFKTLDLLVCNFLCRPKCSQTKQEPNLATHQPQKHLGHMIFSSAAWITVSWTCLFDLEKTTYKQISEVPIFVPEPSSGRWCPNDSSSRSDLSLLAETKTQSSLQPHNLGMWGMGTCVRFSQDHQFAGKNTKSRSQRWDTQSHRGWKDPGWV